MSSDSDSVRVLLERWSEGRPEALDELIPHVYSELRRLARHQLRREPPGHTLQPTALAHELFIELTRQRRVTWESPAHFFAVASFMMRRILAAHARKQGAAKRGGAATRITLDEGTAATAALDVDVAALHEALVRLEDLDERQVRVVELRYFGGLSIDDVADVLSVSPATVKRDWSVARLWLRRELSKGVDEV